MVLLAVMFHLSHMKKQIVQDFLQISLLVPYICLISLLSPYFIPNYSEMGIKITC